MAVLARTVLWTLALLPLAGCATPSIEAGPIYPSEAARASTLDIQVIRRGNRIELTNTTARNFDDGMLWVNGWWGHPIERLHVGETVRLSLWDFRDAYNGKFRAGGFFARERPDRIVLAELQTAEGLTPLVVVDRTMEVIE